MSIRKLFLGAASFALVLLAVRGVSADTNSITFEPPTYTLGNINGQDGWMKTGAYDSEVAANTYGYTTFGTQSLRISNAVTSGAFGDQTFAKPLADAVGETGATAGSYSVGTRQTHYELQFDIASTVPTAQQPGLAMSVSPDRGDGSRMSYLRFEDGTAGLNVFFDDVSGTTSPVSFDEVQVGTDLNRAVPHTVKLTFDAVEGPSNDVVKVYIDGTLVKTGTSWENYYRYDAEASAEQTPRIVKTAIFRTGGTAVPANSGKGFLFDNVTLTSGVVVTGPTNKDQCKKDGWKTFTNPTFKNQGQCVKYVEHLQEQENEDRENEREHQDKHENEEHHDRSENRSNRDR